MKNLILITLMLSLNTLFSQITQQWAKSQSGSGYDVAIDPVGNIYVCGCGYIHYSDFVIYKYSAAGNLIWNVDISGVDTGCIPEVAKSLAVDLYGYLYVTGYIFNQTKGDHDFLTVKYDSAGTEQWRQNYGLKGHYEGSCVAVDNSGNVYVSGYGGISYNSVDYVTLKYSPSGALLWMKKYTGPGLARDYSVSLALDGLGNVIITGYSDGGSTGNDIATIKYNPSGVQQWVNRYNGPANGTDEACRVTADALGNVYVTGTSEGSDSQDMVTIKYSSIGTQVWVNRYDRAGVSAEYGEDVKTDNSGNVYVTGYSSFGEDQEDIVTLKYNSAGTQQWVRIYNSPDNFDDFSTGMAIDNSDNIYITGFSATGSHSDDDNYATIKYNSDGVRMWVATFNGNANYQDYATAIAVKGNAVVVTGNSRGADYQYDAVTVKYVQSHGLNSPEQRIAEQISEMTELVSWGNLDKVNGNVLNVKLEAVREEMNRGDNQKAIKLLSEYNSLVDELVRTRKLVPEYGESLIAEAKYTIGNLNHDNIKVNEVPQRFTLEQNFPNPFNPVTNIKFSLPESGFVKLEIIDVTGKIVDNLVNENFEAGNYNINWNADRFSSGIYFYRITAGDYNQTRKMILLK